VCIVNSCDATIARTDFRSDPDATLARTDFRSELYRSNLCLDSLTPTLAWISPAPTCLDSSRSNDYSDLCHSGKRSVECTTICIKSSLLNKWQIKKYKTCYFNWNRFSVELSKIQRDSTMIGNSVGKKGRIGVYLKECG
jgi:hypothetical protein